jgi:hypothetical protein
MVRNFCFLDPCSPVQVRPKIGSASRTRQFCYSHGSELFTLSQVRIAVLNSNPYPVMQYIIDNAIVAMHAVGEK